MQTFVISPKAILQSLLQNRNIIWALTKREIRGRYHNSLLGMPWAIVHPLLMLAAYTFVFGVAFNARWIPSNESKAEFALVLYAGLAIYSFFTECLSRSPALIISNTSYVKKIIFPLEILPWVTLGTALFNLMISFIIWLGFYLVLYGLPHLTSLYFPLIMLPLILLIMGASWFLASLGVYLRDTSHIIGIMTSILIFFTPIFYPITAIPVAYQPLLYFNPLTTIVEQGRNVLIWGKSPEWGTLLNLTIICSIFCWLGFIWFQKTRKGFADVL